MNKFIQFLRESSTEMLENVSWTKYPKLQSSAITVIVATLIFSLVIWVMDLMMKEGMQFLYGLF